MDVGIGVVGVGLGVEVGRTGGVEETTSVDVDVNAGVIVVGAATGTWSGVGDSTTRGSPPHAVTTNNVHKIHQRFIR